MEIPQFVRTDDAAYVRDTRSKALISTDTVGLAKNRAQRAKHQEHLQLTQQVHNLQEEMRTLKTLLGQLLTHAPI